MNKHENTNGIKDKNLIDRLRLMVNWNENIKKEYRNKYYPMFKTERKKALTSLDEKEYNDWQKKDIKKMLEFNKLNNIKHTYI